MRKIEMRQNIQEFTTKYSVHLAALGWQMFQAAGRCAVGIALPTGFGVGSDAELTDVQIFTVNPNMNRLQQLFCWLVLLPYWPNPLLRLFSKGQSDLHLKSKILRYDPKKEIVVFVTYPNGQWLVWRSEAELTPPEAWAQTSAHIDKKRVRES